MCGPFVAQGAKRGRRVPLAWLGGTGEVLGLASRSKKDMRKIQFKEHPQYLYSLINIYIHWSTYFITIYLFEQKIIFCKSNSCNEKDLG
jgi:hypothetical protein